MPWVGNAGQWDARAAWRAQTCAGASWVTRDGLLVHEFSGPRASDCAGEKGAAALPRHRAEACPRGSGWVITERFVGGRIGPIEGQRPQPGQVSFFTAGRAAAELSTFEALDLGEVYPGVRVELKARAGNVEKLYTVAPGREARVIRMRLEGARSVRIAEDGALEAGTDHGPIRFTAPVAFQHDARGERREVEVRYALLARAGKAVDYGFELGDDDRNRPLTIDPRLQSTYLGGGGVDPASTLAIHPLSGEVYVAGETTGSFPGTAGGAQPSFGGVGDAFVSRLNASLVMPQQSTYLGGSGLDLARAVAIHPATGEVYVVGRTGSLPFPGTAGGAQANYGGGVWDTFVTRFSASLKELHQSTFLGGGDSEYGNAIAIHPLSGDVYVAGETESNPFPGTLGGVQSAYGGGDNDVFIVRLDAMLRTGHQATYLGGNRVERPFALAIHPQDGAVYVAGETTIGGEEGVVNFPGTAGGAQSSPAGDGDAFVSRLSLDLMSADVVPDPFVLPTQLGVPVSSLRTAGPVRVTGLGALAPITIDGALGSAVCVSSTNACSCDASPGGVFGPAANIANNEHLCVRHMSATTVETVNESRVVVGGYATKFRTVTSASGVSCNLDMDNDGQVTASKEMLVMTRARLGLTPAQAVVGTGITQAQWDAKRAALAACGIVF